MNYRTTSPYKPPERQLPSLPRHARNASIDSSISGSDSSSWLRSPQPSIASTMASPAIPSSRPSSDSCPATSISSDTSVRSAIESVVTVSFTRGSKLFKLRYTHLEVVKDSRGDLKRIELCDFPGLPPSLIHSFSGARRPIPHLEVPAVSTDKACLRVSFLEPQTVQTSQVVFSAEPRYTFEKEEDCIRFQESLFNQTVEFTAGLAEAKSKGRGEECSSQNIRVLQNANGSSTLLYFANSQRKEKKRYVSIPLNCVDHIEQNSKPGKPIKMRLRPNFDHLAEMKTLQLVFLNDYDQKRFYGILCQTVGFQPGSK